MSVVSRRAASPWRALPASVRWLAGTVAAVAMLTAWGWATAGIVFTNPVVHAGLVLAALVLPVLTGFWVARRAPWRWLRASAWVLTSAVLGCEILFGPFAACAAAGDEVIRTYAVGSSRLVLQRTNCGATCDYGLEVYQEAGVAPGIVRRSYLGSWYPAYDARVALVGRDSVRLAIVGRGAPARAVVLALPLRR